MLTRRGMAFPRNLGCLRTPLLCPGNLYLQPTNSRALNRSLPVLGIQNVSRPYNVEAHLLGSTAWLTLSPHSVPFVPRTMSSRRAHSTRRTPPPANGNASATPKQPAHETNSHSHSHSFFGHSHSHGEEDRAQGAENIIAAFKGAGTYARVIHALTYDPSRR